MVGETLSELESDTAPEFESDADTAFVDDHAMSALLPLVTFEGAAEMLQEGAMLLPPPKIICPGW